MMEFLVMLILLMFYVCGAMAFQFPYSGWVHEALECTDTKTMEIWAWSDASSTTAPNPRPTFNVTLQRSITAWGGRNFTYPIFYGNAFLQIHVVQFATNIGPSTSGPVGYTLQLTDDGNGGKPTNPTWGWYASGQIQRKVAGRTCTSIYWTNGRQHYAALVTNLTATTTCMYYNTPGNLPTCAGQMGSCRATSNCRAGDTKSISGSWCYPAGELDNLNGYGSFSFKMSSIGMALNPPNVWTAAPDPTLQLTYTGLATHLPQFKAAMKAVIEQGSYQACTGSPTGYTCSTSPCGVGSDNWGMAWGCCFPTSVAVQLVQGPFLNGSYASFDTAGPDIDGALVFTLGQTDVHQLNLCNVAAAAFTKLLGGLSNIFPPAGVMDVALNAAFTAAQAITGSGGSMAQWSC